MVFERIMVPVDLAHAERLEQALACAGDLAEHYGVPITYVGVTSTSPSTVARTPQEFEHKLISFSRAEAEKYGVSTEAYMALANDPTTEVDDALMSAIDQTGADLVVMASHVPGIVDHFWPSNGGKLAQYANCSVMVVRL